MANTTITNLPTVNGLNGTEPLLGVQSGSSVQITTGQIAGLSKGSSTLAFPVSIGGTGDTTLTQYGLMYGNGTAAVGTVAPPSGTNYVLVGSAGSAPTWQPTIPVTAGVDSVAFGTTGLTPTAATAGVVSVAFGSVPTAAGIYSPATNQIALSTNSTRQLFIDASGNTTITGTVTAPSYVANGTITGSLTQGAYSYGTLGYSDTNIFQSFASSVNSYNQKVIQNTNSGASASTNIIVSNNLGTASIYFGEFGMNSSGFSGTGAFNAANTVYLDATSADLAIGTTTSNAIHFVVNGSATDTITLPSSGTLFQGDFSNATLLSRLSFQTYTTNSSTGIYALPNGTSTAASWQAANAADPTNASKILIATNASVDVQLVSGINGTGTYLPLAFYNGGLGRFVVGTSGQFGIGPTATVSYGTSGQVFVSGGASAAPSWASTLSLTGLTITSTSANALAVGPAGTTNPSFNVDASTTSAATGFNIKSAAAGGGVALSAISSGTNENLTLNAKGSGTITIGGVSTGAVIATTAITFNTTTNNQSYTTTGAGTITISSGTAGSINNMTIGNSTAAAGTFTTLTATGAITLNTTTNNQSYTTTGAGTITVSSGTTGSINNMTIGNSTAAAGTFTALTAINSANLSTSGQVIISPLITGTIDNMTIGGTTRAAGSFTFVGAGKANSTAAFVNTAAGTNAIAPIQLTSGTNLTTAAAGAIEYDGSVQYFSPAASTRSTVAAEQVVVLNTAYTLTSATGVQKLFNNTTNGAVTLPVGTYQFECYVTLSTLAATGTFGFALAGGATYTQYWQATGARVAAGTAATASTSFNTTANAAITPTSATTTAYMWIRGVLNVTVTGTVIPQFSQTVASAAVVGVGSFFKVSPFSGTNSTTNITVGNWS